MKYSNLQLGKNSVQTNLALARGQIDDMSHINKFGFNPSTTNSFETVWDGSNVYGYIDVAIQLTVTSASGATDNGVVVELQGLDSNYNQLTRSVTLAGSGTATTTETFKRIFRARVTSGTPDGNITIGDSQTYAQIIAGNNQTLMAVYTIPAGHTGYLVKFQGSQQKDQDTDFQLLARPFGEVLQTKGRWAGRGGQINYDYPVPLKFEAKTDIEVRVKTSSTSAAGALFDIILIED